MIEVIFIIILAACIVSIIFMYLTSETTKKIIKVIKDTNVEPKVQSPESNNSGDLAYAINKQNKKEALNWWYSKKTIEKKEILSSLGYSTTIGNLSTKDIVQIHCAYMNLKS